MKTLNFFLLFNLLAGVLFSQGAPVRKINGIVSDAVTREALEKAEVQVLGTNQFARTDRTGHFTIFMENAGALVTLKITLADYRTVQLQVKLPQPDFLDIRMEKDGQLPTPKIKIESAVVGSAISGKVEGLAEQDKGKYKILVYFLTNQYYIHPYAQSSLTVRGNGAWKVASVRHPGPCPVKILAALVPKDWQIQDIIQGPSEQFVDWFEVDDSQIDCR